MKKLLSITKALSDLNRVRILMMLASQKELCVCQIIKILELAPSTVSRHLNILYSADLVSSRKEGRWIYYRLPRAKEHPISYEVTKWLKKHSANEDLIEKDKSAMKNALEMDKTDLCNLYGYRNCKTKAS